MNQVLIYLTALPQLSPPDLHQVISILPINSITWQFCCICRVKVLARTDFTLWTRPRFTQHKVDLELHLLKQYQDTDHNKVPFRGRTGGKTAKFHIYKFSLSPSSITGTKNNLGLVCFTADFTITIDSYKIPFLFTTVLQKQPRSFDPIAHVHINC